MHFDILNALDTLTQKMQKYYHVTIEALKQNIIFATREDFITGVNDIAICDQKHKVSILAFCLMNNHFHFILKGEDQEIINFCEEYKRMCSIRMHDTRGESGALRKVNLHYDIITSDDYLKNAIAYVLRNPIAAKIKIMPYHYKWSSASAYFMGDNTNEHKNLNDLGLRQRIAIMKSRQCMPDNIRIDTSGMVATSCFIDTGTVENLFKHPSVLMMALAKKIEAEVELSMGITEKISLNDSALISCVNQIIMAEFGARNISQVDIEDKIRLCLKLKRDYNASASQISRVLKISQDIVESVI